MAKSSGIVECLDDDFVLDEEAFEGLLPTIGPAVEERVDVSTFSADFALATIPLLNDDLTCIKKKIYKNYFILYIHRILAHVLSQGANYTVVLP